MKRILIAGHPSKTINYMNALQQMGAEPVTSLHVPDTSDYDALLLPGGGDIDPILFGQLNNGSRSIDSALDRIQMMILKDFVREKKPVLGICKGMQLINIFFDGDIIQDLPTHAAHEYVEHDQMHCTAALGGSFLSRLYGMQFSVNSAHHQGCHTPGKNITYIQFAADGVVEALNHTSLPVIGVQWHPERMCFQYANEELADGRHIFSYFLQKCT